ncbi:MAG: polysaccharide deacetylase family protein [Bacilli bacterium]|nr:polysaccharide deacetylase family protein [Bacilli bacterium]
MKNKKSSIIYLILISIITFVLIIFNLFSYIKNLNKLYDDNFLEKNNSVLNYPYFNDEKDIFITEYLNIIDLSKVDRTNYLVNYLGEYTNVIFRLYKEDIIVDYYSIIFDKNNIPVEICDILKSEEEYKKKIANIINHNQIKLSIKEFEYAKKSYLFKDTELEVYITNYNKNKTITVLTINYHELKDNLIIPFKLDKKYKGIIGSDKEEHITPIISEIDVENQKLVAFTFDDGPSKYTSELLDILDEFNANATFFLVGYNVKIRNSIVLDMYNRGFEIGNHTIDHSRLTKFNCEKANQKITQNEKLVESIINYKMNLVRPPYGAINKKLRECLDYSMILWSVDSRDWESRNTEKIVTEVLSNIKENDIVLFHDLYPTTIDAIKVLLPILYADGFKVVSVSELFAAKKIPLESYKIYSKASV